MTQGSGYAVEVGTVTTRKGARLHIASGCYWSQLLTVVGVVELSEANAHRTCRNCRTAIRAALEAARTTNGERTESSWYVKEDKGNVEKRLTILVNLFLTAAETARNAELVARYERPQVEVFASSGFSGAQFKPVAVVAEPTLLDLIPATKPLSKLGALVVSLGGSPQGAARDRIAARRAARNYQPKAA